MSIAEAMDKIMEKATPLLQGLSMVFGKKAVLTLIVQAEGKPGCLVLSPKHQPTSDIIKALKEADEMAANSQNEFT